MSEIEADRPRRGRPLDLGFSAGILFPNAQLSAAVSLGAWLTIQLALPPDRRSEE